MGNRLIRHVHTTIEKYRMLNCGDHVLVSVSGGPDSVFLLHALQALESEYRLVLKVFHLDHSTRGHQSQADASFVSSLCKRDGLALEQRKVDAQTWSRQRGYSFQEGARELRLKLLGETAKKEGMHKIAVGHHADDSIETFFFNIFRGSGISGLGAIRPVSDKIIRPLIEIYRSDIVAYLQQKNIPYRTDSSNLELDYARNRIRHKVVPLLEKEFDFKKNVLNLTRIARDEDAFMAGLARKALQDHARVLKRDKKVLLIKIQLSFLQDLEMALRRRIIREALHMVRASSKDTTFENIAQLSSICPGGESKKYQPSKDVLAIKEKACLFFINLKLSKFLPRQYQLLLDKQKVAQELVLEIGRRDFCPAFNVHVFTQVRSPMHENEYCSASPMDAFLDYDKIQFPVKIRSWRHGDRFYPLGTGGEKKLQDFFTDQKIPRHRRGLVPIFEDTEKIIWVAGFRIDERVKIEPDTKKVLYINCY